MNSFYLYDKLKISFYDNLLIVQCWQFQSSMYDYSRHFCFAIESFFDLLHIKEND